MSLYRHIVLVSIAALGTGEVATTMSSGGSGGGGGTGSSFHHATAWSSGGNGGGGGNGSTVAATTVAVDVHVLSNGSQCPHCQNSPSGLPAPVDWPVPTPAPMATVDKTCGGTAKGAACEFPFSYKGISYSNCTLADHSKLWCFTQNSSQAWWGLCECPDVADPPPTPYPTAGPHATTYSTTQVVSTPDATPPPTTQVLATAAATTYTTTQVAATPDATPPPTTQVLATPAATTYTTTQVVATPDATPPPTTQVLATPAATTYTTTQVVATPDATPPPTTQVLATPAATSYTATQVAAQYPTPYPTAQVLATPYPTPFPTHRAATPWGTTNETPFPTPAATPYPTAQATPYPTPQVFPTPYPTAQVFPTPYPTAQVAQITCELARSAWVGWSAVKRDWCCRHRGLNCPDVKYPMMHALGPVADTPVPFNQQPIRIEGTEPQQQHWSLSGGQNCQEGYGARASWTSSKKTWCCHHNGIACHDVSYPNTYPGPFPPSYCAVHSCDPVDAWHHVYYDKAEERDIGEVASTDALVHPLAVKIMFLCAFGSVVGVAAMVGMRVCRPPIDRSLQASYRKPLPATRGYEELEAFVVDDTCAEAMPRYIAEPDPFSVADSFEAFQETVPQYVARSVWAGSRGPAREVRMTGIERELDA